MKTALILVAGLVTDRIGGASSLLWGNAVFSVGAILIAAAAPLGRLLRRPKALRALDVLTGGVFVTFGLRLATSHAP